MKRLFPLLALLCAALLVILPGLAGSLSTDGPKNMTIVTVTEAPAVLLTPTPVPAADPVIVVLQELPPDDVPPPVVEHVVEDIDLDEPAAEPTAAPESTEAPGSPDFLGFLKAHWTILAAAVGGVTALVVVLAVLVRLAGRKRRRRDPDAYGAYIASWLNRRGFAEIDTEGRAAGDGVLITCRALRGTRVAVLCVLSDGAVTYRTVQQADEIKDGCGCLKAAVVTNGTFSRQAIEGAKALNIELMAGIE